MKLVLSLIGSVAAMAPAPGKEAVRSLLEAEVTEARSKQDAGWWGDVPLADVRFRVLFCPPIFSPRSRIFRPPSPHIQMFTPPPLIRRRPRSRITPS